MVKKFTAVVEGNIYICFSEMTKYLLKNFHHDLEKFQNVQYSSWILIFNSAMNNIGESQF